MKWTSKITYVDIETGEIIENWEQVKQDFIIIKKEKHATISSNKAYGVNYWTIKVRRTKNSRTIQQRLI